MSRSTYQTNGKPLSQQALYQQKLKQGIYTTPGVPSVGVNSSASDAAALLAASADLTVKPSYERTVAQDAHHAALAVKRDSTQAWSRDQVDPSATSAALAAKIQKTQSSVSNTGVPKYDVDKVMRAATLNSTSSLASRSTPDKLPSKHGLVLKNSNSSFDISKVALAANRNSTKSLNSRFNPDLDYRSGIASHQPPAEYLNQEEEDLAAEGAAASLKHGAGYTDDVSTRLRSKSFRAVDVVDATLLAAASAKANDRLQSLNLTTPLDFKQQAQQYARALTIAQKNSEERIKNNKAGLINLGGGLTMAQSELDKLASLIVQPVLKDIDSKASLQRENDTIARKKHAENVKKHNQAKQDEIAAKNKEKADIEQAKRERDDANSDKKKSEEDKYAEYQAERNEEVLAKSREFKELEEKYAGEKEVLLQGKQENQDRIDGEETELKSGRKLELDTMQAEKDEILKPILAELEEETTKLNDLTNARDELQKEVDTSDSLNKEYEAKLAELTTKLEETTAEIEKYTADLEEATAKHDETSKTVDELNLASIEKLKNHEDSHKDLDTKIDELTKAKEENLKAKEEQKQLILDETQRKIKDEHEINNALPEHLRKTIDEKQLGDTGSLFTVEAKEPEPEPEPVTPVEDKPAPVASSPSKKKGFRKRISGIFSSSKTSPVKSKLDDAQFKPKRSDTKRSVSETKTSDVKPARSNSKSDKGRSNSEVSNGEYDDISIDAQNPSGGLFKEEI